MSGEFLLSYASFDTENRPFLEWQIDGKTERGDVLGQELSLAFDFSTKYCTGGWILKIIATRFVLTVPRLMRNMKIA